MLSFQINFFLFSSGQQLRTVALDLVERMAQKNSSLSSADATSILSQAVNLATKTGISSGNSPTAADSASRYNQAVTKLASAAIQNHLPGQNAINIGSEGGIQVIAQKLDNGPTTLQLPPKSSSTQNQMMFSVSEDKGKSSLQGLAAVNLVTPRGVQPQSRLPGVKSDVTSVTLVDNSGLARHDGIVVNISVPASPNVGKDNMELVHFWNTTTQKYSRLGCLDDNSATASSSSSKTTLTTCYHLTDFAQVEAPTNAPLLTINFSSEASVNWNLKHQYLLSFLMSPHRHGNPGSTSR